MKKSLIGFFATLLLLAITLSVSGCAWILGGETRGGEVALSKHMTEEFPGKKAGISITVIVGEDGEKIVTEEGDKP